MIKDITEKYSTEELLLFHNIFSLGMRIGESMERKGNLVFSQAEIDEEFQCVINLLREDYDNRIGILQKFVPARD